jgi:hypothetical protein
MIIFVPPKPDFDSTAYALLAAGARFLQAQVPFVTLDKE